MEIIMGVNPGIVKDVLKFQSSIVAITGIRKHWTLFACSAARGCPEISRVYLGIW
jgi:hypothetical protein